MVDGLLLGVAEAGSSRRVCLALPGHALLLHGFTEAGYNDPITWGASRYGHTPP